MLVNHLTPIVLLLMQNKNPKIGENNCREIMTFFKIKISYTKEFWYTFIEILKNKNDVKAMQKTCPNPPNLGLERNYGDSKG